jgi:hypothetical protein
LVLD